MRLTISTAYPAGEARDEINEGPGSLAEGDSSTYDWKMYPENPSGYKFDGVIYRRSEIKLSDITVGVSNTYLLGEKYRFTHRTAPAIATTLGIDTEPVRRAYQRLYRAPIESIFAAHLSPLQQLQWVQLDQ